mmetsp:Transcript_91880/g.159386  ORF Transcript_91880/g.159386 Transcript_91880/m.159386 type:complete len:104 (-) Transcript_91880:836-1147(-)
MPKSMGSVCQGQGWACLLGLGKDLQKDPVRGHESRGLPTAVGMNTLGFSGWRGFHGSPPHQLWQWCVFQRCHRDEEKHEAGARTGEKWEGLGQRKDTAKATGR